MGSHRAAVLGSPIGHSLSPALHRAAYSQLGLDWRYDAFDRDGSSLAGFVSELGEEWAGLSLTMPLKRAVLPLLDERSELVELIGVANTVVLRGGTRAGHNTDVDGLVNALREHGVHTADRPVLIGGGATAASGLAALQRMGAARATVVVRRPAAAGDLRELAQRLGLGLDVMAWDVPAVARHLVTSDLVVATSPAGSTDDIAAALAAGAPVTGVLFDVIYAPWPTPLAAAWEHLGGRVVGGLDLLVHQAALQVALMVGPVLGRAVGVTQELTSAMREAGLLGLKTQAG